MEELENLVPSIYYVVLKKCPATWELSNAVLKFHNFMLVLDGELYVSHDSGEHFHTVSKGYLYYGPKGATRMAYTSSEHPVYCYAVNFQYAILKKDEENWQLNENAPQLPLDRIMHIRNMDALAALFKELNREWQGKRKGYLLKCRVLLMEIIHQLLRESSLGVEDGSKMRKVEKVMNYISENHRENISLEEMAKMANLSPVYFGSLFKKLSGLTPKEYQNVVRIHKARDLLLSGGYTVGEAAESVGFSDIYYFSRTFKKITGQKPSDFKA